MIVDEFFSLYICIERNCFITKTSTAHTVRANGRQYNLNATRKRKASCRRHTSDLTQSVYCKYTYILVSYWRPRCRVNDKNVVATIIITKKLHPMAP